MEMRCILNVMYSQKLNDCKNPCYIISPGVNEVIEDRDEDEDDDGVE